MMPTFFLFGFAFITQVKITASIQILIKFVQVVLEKKDKKIEVKETKFTSNSLLVITS